MFVINLLDPRMMLDVAVSEIYRSSAWDRIAFLLEYLNLYTSSSIHSKAIDGIILEPLFGEFDE